MAQYAFAGIARLARAAGWAEAPAGAEIVLSGFATKLSGTPGELAEFGRRFNRAVKVRDWDGYARSLSQLVEKITFLAGVALRIPNEAQAALVARADQAMYKAKKAGKNRVVVAE